MLAPQRVMDAYDSLVDYIFSALEKTPPNDPHADWKETRRLFYNLVNEIRDDVGIDRSKIVYRGER